MTLWLSSTAIMWLSNTRFFANHHENFHYNFIALRFTSNNFQHSRLSRFILNFWFTCKTNWKKKFFWSSIKFLTFTRNIFHLLFFHTCGNQTLELFSSDLTRKIDLSVEKHPSGDHSAKVNVVILLGYWRENMAFSLENWSFFK